MYWDLPPSPPLTEGLNMTTVELNYAGEHEFIPMPSIFINAPALNERQMHRRVANAIIEAVEWDDAPTLGRRIAEDLFKTDLATLNVETDERQILTINLRQQTVDVWLNGEYATLTFSAFIVIAMDGISARAAVIARAIAKG